MLCQMISSLGSQANTRSHLRTLLWSIAGGSLSNHLIWLAEEWCSSFPSFQVNPPAKPKEECTKPTKVRHLFLTYAGGADLIMIQCKHLSGGGVVLTSNLRSSHVTVYVLVGVERSFPGVHIIFLSSLRILNFQTFKP